MKNTAVIVAAGRGKRIGGTTPKQYLKLAGQPVLTWTIRAFQGVSEIDSIVLVVGADDEDFVRDRIVNAGGFDKVCAVVAGGEQRFDSVYAGLLACDADTEFVLIHDGARPCVGADVIRRGLAMAKECGSAVAGLPATDTIKRVDEAGEVIETPDRANLWTVQTPQIFRHASILAAYEAMRAAGSNTAVTDDAQVMELYGKDKVCLYEGDVRNIKITTPEDFRIVEISAWM